VKRASEKKRTKHAADVLADRAFGEDGKPAALSARTLSTRAARSKMRETLGKKRQKREAPAACALGASLTATSTEVRVEKKLTPLRHQ